MKLLYVVYFDQLLGAWAPKNWSKQTKKNTYKYLFELYGPKNIQ